MIKNILIMLVSVIVLLASTNIFSKENINFEEIKKNISDKKHTPIIQIASTPQIEEKKSQLFISDMNERIDYYNKIIEQRDHEWEQRRLAITWQFWSSVIIFLIVTMIVLLGIYFSYIHFKENNVNEDNRTNLKLSKDGVEISSPIIGVIILFISMGFFYLYLKEVYPIKLIGSENFKQEINSPQNKLK